MVSLATLLLRGWTSDGSGRIVTMSDYFFQSNRRLRRFIKGMQLQKCFFGFGSLSGGSPIGLGIKTCLSRIVTTCPESSLKNIEI